MNERRARRAHFGFHFGEQLPRIHVVSCTLRT
jgi:hypothetical protein